MNEDREAGQRPPGPIDLAVAAGWSVAMFVGVVTIAVGAIVLVWPDQTLVVLSVLLGIQLLLFGVWRLIAAFSGATALSPGLVGFVGIIAMVVGVAVLRHPFETVAILATLLGIVWVVTGAIDVISAIVGPTPMDRGLTVMAGIVSIAAGIVVVSWPAPTVTVIAWIAGLYLVIAGIMLCSTAFKLKSVAEAA